MSHMNHYIYKMRSTGVLCLLLVALQLNALDKIGNVYCIYNATDLNEFGKVVAGGDSTANGMLMNDIDFSGWGEWEPIGGRGGKIPYRGHFDGGGHRIMNFNIDNDSRNWSAQGVFGAVTAGCVIANLIFDKSSSIKGKNFVGGIAGEVRGDAAGTVKFVNCGNEGSVTGNTTSGEKAGGILGGSSSSVIQIEFKNCFNSGNVKGYSWCGSISGNIGTAIAPIVTNCYSTGSVTEGIGGSRNFVANCNSFTNCYYLSGTCTNYGNATAVSTADDLIGKFGDDYEGLYPYVPTFEEGYYQISSKRNLLWFRNMVNNYLSVNGRQTAAIDLAGEEWIPIGTYTNAFSGYYDGQWYAINNINHALFGVATNAHFARIAIESGNITPTVMGNGEITTGSIVAQSWAGDASSCTMTYCYSRARLSQDDYVYTRPDGVTSQCVDMGGLAGRFEGTIENCFFAGNINSTHTANSVGGLIGAFNADGKTILRRSYVDAHITASQQQCVGKFAGWYSNECIIEYCVVNDDCGITDDEYGGPWTGNKSGQLTKLINTSDYTTGKDCWVLNQESSVNPTWYQTIGTDSHPVWINAINAKVVYHTLGDEYYNELRGFTHYVGDVYSGKNAWLGSETPSSLQYPSGNWKTHTDDPDLNEGVRLQRIHEYERDVWVFPGVTERIIPFTDFSYVTNYYDNYLRWFDYHTDRKCDKLTFPDGQAVLELDEGVFGGSFLTSNRWNGTYAYYSSSSDASGDVLDVISVEASATCANENFTISSGIGSLTEPNLLFRHIFNIRNARLRADQMTADVNSNNNYIDSYHIKLYAPAGTPFQYRLDSPESILWDDTATPTDYWYQKGDGTYGQVYHYVVETQINGNTYETTNTSISNMLEGRAYTFKSRNNMNLMLYMLNPQVGTYKITLYAADKSGNKINIAGTSTPIKLMAYTLEVMDEKNGNMVTEEDLYAEANKARFQHQWPSWMREYFGAPKTAVNLDNVEPALSKEMFNSEGKSLGFIYRWPRKWEESTYAFGYANRYDYNMYVVANDALATPYHYAMEELCQSIPNYPYKDYVMYDRLYADTQGARKGYFYYTNAASDPGRMTILNIGKNFCTGTEVYVSAWVKEFSMDKETANVVFSFKGVDEKGKETTLNSFVSGYVTGSYNTLKGYDETSTTPSADNPRNQGKWMHVYYHFNAESSGYDHYIISVENNSASSHGADYAIDDIQAYVCRPTVEARQMKPVCNGSVSTNLLLTIDFDRLLKAFANTEASDAESSTTEALDYCFLNKIIFQEEYAKQLAKGKNAEEADRIAFEEALLKGAYGTDDPDDPQYRYGQLTYATHYDSNVRYTGQNDNEIVKRKAMSLEPINGLRSLVFPSDANDTDMKVGSTYMISIIKHKDNPGADDFRFHDECSKVSEFTVIFSGEVKVDGQLQSKEDGISVCANQKPRITIDLNGIGVGGEVHTINEAYFDWYYGPLSADSGAEQDFQNAEYGGVLLKDALAYFRMKYYHATEEDFLDQSKCPTKGDYEQSHYLCIKHFVDEGKLDLYLNANYVSTHEQFNSQFVEGQKFYIVAIPFDPDPSLGYKFCLEPIQIVMNLSSRQPHMKDGGDQDGSIRYPAEMVDVPLRVGLRQLWQARMDDLGTTESVSATPLANYLHLPLRDVAPVTEGVNNLIGKSDDDFVYLVASDDPEVAGGRSGALKVSNDASEGDVRIIGRVANISANKNDPANNSCHLGFIKNFKFREGYSYTIKFHFQEKYDDESESHSDVCSGDVVCTIKVVPEYQKWTGAVNSDWNNDGNWARVSKEELLLANPDDDEWKHFVTDGGEVGNYVNDNLRSFVPADFTKVIIPANARVAPQLYDFRTDNSKDVRFCGNDNRSFLQILNARNHEVTPQIHYEMSSVNAGANVACRPWYDHTCQQIHFKPHTEMLNQQYLMYEKAWVEFCVSTGKWYTLCSPLKSVVAGDMYLPTAGARQMTELFQPITFATSDYNRFNPAVYQRAWNKATATVYEIGGTNRNVAVKTSWSHVYNDVNEDYSHGEGFSIKVDASRQGDAVDEALFRLPKDDASYLYYSDYTTGNVSGNKTAIDRKDLAYRLNDTRGTLEGRSAGNSRYFLIANPFMAHLDMQKFLTVNSDKIYPKYWIMTSESQNAAVMDSASGLFVGNMQDAGMVAPMQSFFVESKTDEASLSLAYKEQMMQLGFSDESGARQFDYSKYDEDSFAKTRSSHTGDGLRITAWRGERPLSQALIHVRAGAHNGYDATEDVALICDEMQDALARVYTVTDHMAVDINTLPEIDSTEVGVLAPAQEQVFLRFTGVDESMGLCLYDKLTSKSTPLTEGMSYEVNGDMSGRLYLVKSHTQEGSGIQITADGNLLCVKDPLGAALTVHVYSSSGMLLGTYHGAGKVVCKVSSGACIVEAMTKDSSSTKTILIP